jgi:hypothetical protein
MKVKMRTTLPDVEHDALEVWVNEHGAEFGTVAVYKAELTMHRAGIPPTTVMHRPGSITEALAAVLEIINSQGLQLSRCSSCRH